MSEFERELPAFRLVETHHGDDLAAVAHRALGDANRWPELVWINSLSFPYITDDPRRAGPGVLLSGALIKVPAPAGVWTDDAERGQVYERDAAMVNRQLLIGDDGDLAVVAGADNLRQQIKHRVDTPRGQLRRHPSYGNLAWRLKGTVNGPVAGMLAAEYTKATVAADYRVAAVEHASAQVLGDSIRVMVKARAVDGGIIDITSGN